MAMEHQAAARSLLAGSPSPEHAAASVLDHQAVPLIPLHVPFSLKPSLPFPHDLSLCLQRSADLEAA